MISLRLAWPRKRRDTRSSVAAALIGTAVTGIAVFLLARSLGRMDAFRESLGRRAASAYEIVTLVFPGLPTRHASSRPQNPARASAAAAARAPTYVRPDPTPSTRDDAPTRLGASEAIARDSHRVAENPVASERSASRAIAGPVFAPSALFRTSTWTARQRDSALSQLSNDIPRLAAKLRPTQEERDAKGREQAAAWAKARDEGRLVPSTIAAGGISLPFPLLSGGPSREQRRRDSIVHHDNVLRLERLAQRVKAKKDSTRIADSIALLTRAHPHDSLDD